MFSLIQACALCSRPVNRHINIVKRFSTSVPRFRTLDVDHSGTVLIGEGNPEKTRIVSRGPEMLITECSLCQAYPYMVYLVHVEHMIVDT